MKRVRDVRDDADQILIDKHGLSRDIMGDLPQKVGDIRDWILLALEDEPEPLDEPTTRRSRGSRTRWTATSPTTPTQPRPN
jgi:hypothetical protein